MWFKHLTAYQLTKPFEYTPDTLAEHLDAARFSPCPKHQLYSAGWTPPSANEEGGLVHAGSGALLVCLKREERILPASVIKDFVAERVETIETTELRKVRKKERDQIRDEVTFDLMPRAFTRSTATQAMVLPAQRLLLVDTSSKRRADEFVELWRTTLSDAPLAIPQVRTAPGELMTRWLNDASTLPEDLALGDECELQDTGEEAGTVRCRRQDLTSEEIRNHLEAGKRCVKLALTWADSLTFVLIDDLGVRRLKYSDELQEQVGEADEAERFDAEFTLMALELSRFVPRLAEVFGGYAEVD